MSTGATPDSTLFSSVLLVRLLLFPTLGGLRSLLRQLFRSGAVARAVSRSQFVRQGAGKAHVRHRQHGTGGAADSGP